MPKLNPKPYRPQSMADDATDLADFFPLHLELSKAGQWLVGIELAVNLRVYIGFREMTIPYSSKDLLVRALDT